MEDSGAKSDLNCTGLDEDISEKKIFSREPRNHSCDILVKNVAAFCLWLKSLPAAKMKSLKLIPLAEEISKLPSIESVV